MEKFFEKRESQSILLDFAASFEEKIIPLEVRIDHFTNCVSRVLKFRYKIPGTGIDSETVDKSKATCPFCPQVRDLFTPKFPASIAPEGRISFGRSTVLPNAFPYSRYCGVTLFSDDHFLFLDQFTPEILFDAFEASRIYISRVRKCDPEAKFASINWNYLMPAGGGLYHPHLQTVVSLQSTNFHTRLINASVKFKIEKEKNYWESLVEYEKEKNERYLFNNGRIEFISIFSPRGMLGEILALFTGVTVFDEITEKDFVSFEKGLFHILKCFHKLGFNSLNMTLLINLIACDDFPIQARITPRISIPPWGTSDVNYFEKGHDEIIVIFPPEEMAKEIKNDAG